MDIFQALGDPTRRRIVEIIAARGHASSSDISKKFTITAPAVSQHLKVLREAHLVDVEKKAQRRIYTLNPKKITEIEEWTRKLKMHWEKKFDRLDTILLEEKRSKGGENK